MIRKCFHDGNDDDDDVKIILYKFFKEVIVVIWKTSEVTVSGTCISKNVRWH